MSAAEIIAELPRLTSLERAEIARHLVELESPAPETAASQLAEMAADPSIQRELRAIEADFRLTEMDGLRVAER